MEEQEDAFLRRKVRREIPNILITGSPGTGKSTLCDTIATATGMNWIEVSAVAKENNCLKEFDDEYQCPVLNEDKLLDGLETCMSKGGNIVDYHSSEMFPERWFDLVFVLTVNNTTLFDRLVNRGYSGKKLTDNMDCEILQVIVAETMQAYDKSIVYPLDNSTFSKRDENVNKILELMQEYINNLEMESQENGNESSESSD